MCDFKAPERLRIRRAIAEDKSLPTKLAAKLIRVIDEDRLDHEDFTGCKCWQEEIAKVRAEMEYTR